MVCRTGDLRPALFGEAAGGITSEWSAAAVHSNRLAALRTHDAAQLRLSAVTASGCEAFLLQMELPRPATARSDEGGGPATPTLVEPTRAVGSTVATHAYVRR